jgi:hypothetical protein
VPLTEYDLKVWRAGSELDAPTLCSEGALQDQGVGEEQACVEAGLVEWCGALDFEQYAQEWRAVATTLGSEAFVRVDEPLPIAPPWISSV